MSYLTILDTNLRLDKNFQSEITKVFGFGFRRLENLNKIFGTNVHKVYRISQLTFLDRTSMIFYLPELKLFGTDLLTKIKMEQDKFLSLKCYKRSRFLLGLPANGQRTHTNAKTCKRLRLKL